MKTKTFTSTISSELLNWVNTYAKDTKQTRRDVLEAAILHYRQDTMRERMRKDFTRAAADQETIELAKWGIDDYRDIEHV